MEKANKMSTKICNCKRCKLYGIYDYEQRVAEKQKEGMSRGDAQAVIEAEDMQKK